MIATLREQRKSWKESAKAASKKVTESRSILTVLSMTRRKAVKVTDHALVLGSGSMIPGFEDGIVGMKKGESKEIEVTFPEDYHAENLKGKPAVFKISVETRARRTTES